MSVDWLPQKLPNDVLKMLRDGRRPLIESKVEVLESDGPPGVMVEVHQFGTLYLDRAAANRLAIDLLTQCGALESNPVK